MDVLWVDVLLLDPIEGFLLIGLEGGIIAVELSWGHAGARGGMLELDNVDSVFIGADLTVYGEGLVVGFGGGKQGIVFEELLVLGLTGEGAIVERGGGGTLIDNGIETNDDEQSENDG